MPTNISTKTMSLKCTCLLTVLVLLLSACDRDQSTQHKKTSPETEMAYIPAGKFLMGTNKLDKEETNNEYGFEEPLYANEYPPHSVNLKAYYIDKYEVTNAQYKTFTKQSQHNWAMNRYNMDLENLKPLSLGRLQYAAENYFKLDINASEMTKDALLKEIALFQNKHDLIPVTKISWYDAEAYCLWAGKRLPSEAEWEKAAHGVHDWDYPWGPDWDPEKTNTGEGENQNEVLLPVGSMPNDVSPYGVYDMAGNVVEWVSDWYEAYPGASYKSPDYNGLHKVVRGGGASAGHYGLSTLFRTANRRHTTPSELNPDVGFRCAKDAH